MTPQKQQHVQVLLRVGGTIEGFVEEWSEGESILKSLDGKSIIIIPKTSDDIMLVRVFLPEKTLPEIKSAIKEKIEEVLQPSGDPEADEANLQQLREMSIQQEKKIIVEKIKEHHSDGVKRVKYGFPTIARTK